MLAQHHEYHHNKWRKTRGTLHSIGVLVQIRYGLAHFLDEVLLFVENVVFVVCFLKLIVSQNIEGIGHFFFCHVVVVEDADVAVEVGVLLVLEPLQIQVTRRLKVLKFGEALHLEDVVESLGPLLHKILRVHVQLAYENYQVNRQFGRKSDFHSGNALLNHLDSDELDEAADASESLLLLPVGITPGRRRVHLSCGRIHFYMIFLKN